MPSCHVRSCLSRLGEEQHYINRHFRQLCTDRVKPGGGMVRQEVILYDKGCFGVNNFFFLFLYKEWQVFFFIIKELL